MGSTLESGESSHQHWKKRSYTWTSKGELILEKEKSSDMNLKGRSVLEQKSLRMRLKGNQHWNQVNHHRHGFKESTRTEYIYENLKRGSEIG